MKVVASDEVVAQVADDGGRLFVWPTRARCCGGLTRLRSSTTTPERRVFRRVDPFQPFELYLPERLARKPDELVLEVRRWPRRVEAYWNGCAWIV